MKKACPYCGRIHDKRYACPKKPKKKGWGRHNSTAGDLRHKNRWTEKSRQIRARDLYCCRYCLDKEEYVNARSISVHHIVPINEEPSLWLEDDNLISLCEKHHNMAEKGLISKKILTELAATAPKITPRLHG